MKDEAINEFARNFLSIIAGAFTAIAVAFALLPVVKLVPFRYVILRDLDWVLPIKEKGRRHK